MESHWGRQYSAGTAADALRDLLGDGSYAGRATAAAAQIQRENGAQTAAEVIEQVLRDGLPAFAGRMRAALEG